MSAQELKCCPFCGTDAVAVSQETKSTWAVYCCECSASLDPEHLSRAEGGVMGARTKRKLIDWVIFVTITATVSLIGGGLWSIPLCTILACWNFYDGMTRNTLPNKE